MDIRQLTLSLSASSDGSGPEQVSEKVENGELGITAESSLAKELEEKNVEKQLDIAAKMTRTRFIEGKEVTENTKSRRRSRCG